jgi:hypothetical protein
MFLRRTNDEASRNSSEEIKPLYAIAAFAGLRLYCADEHCEILHLSGIGHRDAWRFRLLSWSKGGSTATARAQFIQIKSRP